jgi:hypothetical protein
MKHHTAEILKSILGYEKRYQKGKILKAAATINFNHAAEQRTEVKRIQFLRIFEVGFENRSVSGRLHAEFLASQVLPLILSSGVCPLKSVKNFKSQDDTNLEAKRTKFKQYAQDVMLQQHEHKIGMR